MTIKEMNKVLCGCHRGNTYWHAVLLDGRFVIGMARFHHRAIEVEYIKETQVLRFKKPDGGWDSWSEMDRDEIH